MKRISFIGYVLILFFLAAISVIISGIIILLNVNNDIKNGVNEAANIISHNDEYPENNNPDASIACEEKKDYSNAAAILTFIDDNNAQVGIFDGISNDVLKKGAGRDTSTALPNCNGNCVLYAHRDSGFSSLSTIKLNDRISIQTKDSIVIYKVKDIKTTNPEDSCIYKTTKEKQVTLVTCYPFSYVGPAPQRFVVTATENPGQ